MLQVTRKLFFYFIVALWSSQEAAACFAPTKIATVSPEELVARTSNIYLARAVLASDGTVKFSNIEILKGSKKLTSIPDATFTEQSSSDFDMHRSSKFWEALGGRSEISPSCAIAPKFQAGKTYLIFAERPYHFKSFELITNRKDEWLEKVRTILHDKLKR